jgi:hypothetical protein
MLFRSKHFEIFFFLVTAQPIGQPEICKMSLRESTVNGNMELIMIGKNFMKGTKVLSNKYQFHSLWFDSTRNSWSNAIKASMVIIKPLMLLLWFMTRANKYRLKIIFVDFRFFLPYNRSIFTSDFLEEHLFLLLH